MRGGVSCRGGSQEVARPTAITQLASFAKSLKFLDGLLFVLLSVRYKVFMLSESGFSGAHIFHYNRLTIAVKLPTELQVGHKSPGF
jgi:hypothetical protein